MYGRFLDMSCASAFVCASMCVYPEIIYIILYLWYICAHVYVHLCTCVRCVTMCLDYVNIVASTLK